MTSDRIQRQIERFLDAAEQAAERLDWVEAGERAQAVLNLDPENSDAHVYLAAAERAMEAAGNRQQAPPPPRPNRQGRD